jgi:hypothetical protein
LSLFQINLLMRVYTINPLCKLFIHKPIEGIMIEDKNNEKKTKKSGLVRFIAR